MSQGNRPTPEPASADTDTKTSSPTSSETTQSSGSTSPPVFGGIFYGILATIVSSIGVLALFGSRIPNQRLEPYFEAEYTVEFFVWIIYSAYNVDIINKSTGEPLNYLVELPVGNPLHFAAIPAAVLFFCGLLLARKRSTIKDGFRAGTAVTWSYTPLFAIGSYYFEFTQNGVSYGPDMQGAILIAGFGFPLVFAGLGGALSGAT
ncbi:hypothetical protein SAMN06269185_0758 [Natronoarchaeum philippinense]|uniref:DUF7978 domain-containing protein n=1 Tax=Natronoarchaeum philippinense TaxID=558529 RepID=A0A285N6D7_NATPI|nr:hypothetical protein [Natronoarchaeum philippinense]SNZ05044.1 hypothetical protein SAMN06269185_0758 [Natronoarchaeum philippinense]